MKSIIYIIISLISLCFSLENPSSFEGIWHSSEMDNTSIKIYQSEDGYWYGEIIDSDKKENIGYLMLRYLSYSEKHNKLTGEIQKPDKKFKANATLALTSSNELRITAKKFLMSRSFNLKRL